MKNKYVLLFIAFLVFMILHILINKVFHMIFPAHALQNNVNELDSMADKIGLFILFGPLLETLVFQTAIIEMTQYFGKNLRWNTTLCIILSSICFSLIHTYSAAYVLYALISGIMYAVIYIEAKKRNLMATLTVYLFHGLWNLFATFM